MMNEYYYYFKLLVCVTNISNSDGQKIYNNCLNSYFNGNLKPIHYGTDFLLIGQLLFSPFLVIVKGLPTALTSNRTTGKFFQEFQT